MPFAARYFDLVICGAGTAGSAIASKFARKLGNGKVCLIEPHKTHYYQPLWTLVGGGLKKFELSGRPMSSTVPRQADWLQERVSEFRPVENLVLTDAGNVIKYRHLVVALGLDVKFDAVKGLPEALEHDPQVCSNFSPVYVNKTFPAMKHYKGGNAIFTFPASAIKCPGAPQKIMYIFEDYLKRNNKIGSNTSIHYFTSLPAIFGVKKYADILYEICRKRNIQVHTRSHLVEVNYPKQEVTFEHLDTKERRILNYSFLHVTPPMQTPGPLRACINAPASSPAFGFVDGSGFVSVDQHRLQHTKYQNVWALGDCASTPNSKTAAAIAAQAGVLEKHLDTAITGSSLKQVVSYDGYASCPLVTAHNKCVLAEFGYGGKIMETFPVDQGRETRFAYFLKATLMQHLYWHGLVRGYWNGPSFLRKLMRLGFS